MPLDGKTGVLLVNLGTPDSPKRWDVYRYLKQFLLDRRVIDIPWLQRNLLVRGIIAPFRSGSSAKLYQQLWTPEGSPLKVYGEKLRDGMQAKLGDDFVVELAMRYQNPSIEGAIKNLMAHQPTELIVFPLFPHYASASTGSVHDEVMRLLRKEEIIPDIKFINSFYDYEPMLDVFVENARKYNIEEYDHFLFSYHGLPQRQLVRADNCNHCLQSEDCCQTISSKNQHCYSAQSYATTFALVEKLNIPEGKYTTCFQSRLGKTPWTQPYTSEVLEDLAKEGKKKILVFCPAFVSDCLETTIEVSVEYAEEFEELGGETVHLVESLNDHPKWIQGAADLVLENSMKKLKSNSVS